MQKGGVHIEAYGIARPADRVIAMFPHCARGRHAHYRHAMRNWAIWHGWVLGVAAVGTLLLSVPQEGPALAGAVIVVLYSLGWIGKTRDALPLARLAEQVFVTLGLPDGQRLDLPASSRGKRRPGDAGRFGSVYFRY